MKKILTILLLISAVVGMTMPAMANPTINKVVDNDQDATNWANSQIEQELKNSGDLTNVNNQIAIAGDANAKSKAEAEAGGEDESGHGGVGNAGGDNNNDDDQTSADISGVVNGDAGNADSTATATGGDANTNGDNLQINAVVQVAIASISTTQDIVQTIGEDETLDLEVEDSAFVEGNEVDDESSIDNINIPVEE